MNALSIVSGSLQSVSRVALCVVLLAASSFANTWIVDQNSGPGTNFTDIPPAIAASAPGDVIIVRQGSYSGFTLSIGLTILGQGSVKIAFHPQVMNITGVPAGSPAVVVNLASNGIKVIGCSATVILQGCRSGEVVDVWNSADVRLHNLGSPSGPTNWLRAVASRVEVVDSHLLGSPGTHGFDFPGGDGAPGVTVSQSGRVHLSRTSATGGTGGGSSASHGGDGGDGALVSPGAQLIITGGGVGALTGGWEGFGGDCGLDGLTGNGLFNDMAMVWRSGATYHAGLVTGCGHAGLPLVYIPGPGSFDNVVTPDDPTLSLVGTPIPGGTVTVNLYSEPGTLARLILGRTPILMPTPGIEVELLEIRERSLWLGAVPLSGVITQVIKIPAGFPVGSLMLAQGRLLSPATNELRRTNSVAMVVQ